MPLDFYPAAVHGLGFTVTKSPEFKTAIQPSPNAYENRLPQSRNPIWHFILVYNYLYDRYRSPNNTYPYAPYSDLSTLIGFFNAHLGDAIEFLFDDPKDRTAAGVLAGAWKPNHEYLLNQVVIDPKGHAQLATTPGTSGGTQPSIWNSIGGTTNDGSTLVWTDQGSFPDGFPNAPITLQVLDDGFGNFYSPVQRILGGTVYEDITDLNGALTVWADGVLQVEGTDYDLFGPGMILNEVVYTGLYLKWAGQPNPLVTAKFNFYFRLKFETSSQDVEHFMDELWSIGGDSGQSGSGTLKLETARPPSPTQPGPPLPPPAPPPPIVTSAVLNVVSSYEQDGNVGFQPGASLSASSPFAFLSFSGGSFWATRTDTASLAGPVPDSVAGYSGVVVTFQLQETLVQPGGLVKWLIDDVNIDLTFADSSTQTIRPVSTHFTLGTDGGDVLNPNNLIDSNPATGATLESRSGGPLSTNSVFTVTF